MATGVLPVTERWLGGMLLTPPQLAATASNAKIWKTGCSAASWPTRYSKLGSTLKREIDGMNHMYGGIKEMPAKVRPRCLWLMLSNDGIAVKKTIKLDVPVVSFGRYWRPFR